MQMRRVDRVVDRIRNVPILRANVDFVTVQHGGVGVIREIAFVHVVVWCRVVVQRSLMESLCVECVRRLPEVVHQLTGVQSVRFALLLLKQQLLLTGKVVLLIAGWHELADRHHLVRIGQTFDHRLTLVRRLLFDQLARVDQRRLRVRHEDVAEVVRADQRRLVHGVEARHVADQRLVRNAEHLVLRAQFASALRRGRPVIVEAQFKCVVIGVVHYAWSVAERLQTRQMIADGRLVLVNIAQVVIVMLAALQTRARTATVDYAENDDGDQDG